MTLPITYTPSANAVLDARLLERQLDVCATSINDVSAYAEGKRSISFDPGKRPIYNEVNSFGDRACFGKNYVPLDTSNANDFIYLNRSGGAAPILDLANYRSNTTFGVVTLSASNQAVVKGAALNYPPMIGYFHVIADTGSGLGGRNVSPIFSPTAANQIIARPHNPAVGALGVADSPTVGCSIFSLATTSWVMNATWAYMGHVTVKLYATANVYGFQFRIGQSTMGYDNTTMIGFKLTGYAV